MGNTEHNTKKKFTWKIRKINKAVVNFCTTFIIFGAMVAFGADTPAFGAPTKSDARAAVKSGKVSLPAAKARVEQKLSARDANTVARLANLSPAAGNTKIRDIRIGKSNGLTTLKVGKVDGKPTVSRDDGLITYTTPIQAITNGADGRVLNVPQRVASTILNSVVNLEGVTDSTGPESRGVKSGRITVGKIDPVSRPTPIDPPSGGTIDPEKRRVVVTPIAPPSGGLSNGPVIIGGSSSGSSSGGSTSGGTTVRPTTPPPGGLSNGPFVVGGSTSGGSGSSSGGSSSGGSTSGGSSSGPGTTVRPTTPPPGGLSNGPFVVGGSTSGGSGGSSGGSSSGGSSSGGSTSGGTTTDGVVNVLNGLDTGNGNLPTFTDTSTAALAGLEPAAGGEGEFCEVVNPGNPSICTKSAQ